MYIMLLIPIWFRDATLYTFGNEKGIPASKAGKDVFLFLLMIV